MSFVQHFTRTWETKFLGIAESVDNQCYGICNWLWYVA